MATSKNTAVFTTSRMSRTLDDKVKKIRSNARSIESDQIDTEPEGNPEPFKRKLSDDAPVKKEADKQEGQQRRMSRRVLRLSGKRCARYSRLQPREMEAEM